EHALQRALGEGTFDLVTAIDVLYHLVSDDDFERGLRALGARVRYGGHLLLSDVFVEAPTSIAAHVPRRPMDTYTRILGELGLELAAREPVFAILGDPVIHRGFRPHELLLSSVWRVLSKTIRTVPARSRDLVGAFCARLLVPVDAMLRRSRIGRGTNL